MSRICVKLQMELLSEAIFSSGNSLPGGEDIALRLDENGRPLLSGSTFKGLLKEELTNYLSWSGSGTNPAELLGSDGWTGEESERRLIFGDLRLAGGGLSAADWSGLRTFTSLKDGVVDSGTLRTAACLHRGLVFEGVMFCLQEDLTTVQNSVRCIQYVGLHRNRGFGHVRVTAEGGGVLRVREPVAPGHWLRYRLKLETPLAISWLSQSGTGDEDKRNYTEGRNYLPGSAVRGMVMSTLAREDEAWFEENKEALLRAVSFRNALPLMEEGNQYVPLIPTPKGFYEAKDSADGKHDVCGNFYSVLYHDVVGGDKRASAGSYCRVVDGMLRPESPAMETALRIRREDKRLFTVRAMAAGTILEGFIRVEDPALLPKIASVFREYVWLGADRYAGSGLCQVLVCKPEAPVYSHNYGYAAQDKIPENPVMMLMSPTAMSKDGEVVGLDLGQLAKELGVERVSIRRCATSTMEAAGYNRTWGCFTPAVSMYDTGSVFALECVPAPSREKLEALEERGVGIRREEGFGQLLFLKDFDKIRGTAKAEDDRIIQTRVVQLRQARCRWLLKEQVPAGLSQSQLGNLQAVCESVYYDVKTVDGLWEYLDHNMTNRSPALRDKYIPIHRKLNEIMNQPLSQTLGFPCEADGEKERLRLFIDWLDLSRKGGV